LPNRSAKASFDADPITQPDVIGSIDLETLSVVFGDSTFPVFGVYKPWQGLGLGDGDPWDDSLPLSSF
jgi:hypothetical protein